MMVPQAGKNLCSSTVPLLIHCVPLHKVQFCSAPFLFCYICADWWDNLSFSTDATREVWRAGDGWQPLKGELV